MRTAPMAVPIGFYVQYHPTEIQCAISFGTDEEGYFMQLEFFHAENIPLMDDAFWAEFLELRKHGRLDFGVNAWFTKSQIAKTPKLFKANKSQLFKMLRNFILLEAYDNTGPDLGMITVRWSLNESWEDLIEKGSQVYNQFYKLGKLLQGKQSDKLTKGKSL